MANLPLVFACLKYNHVRALMEGQVRPEGIDLTCLDLDPEETHPRMLRDQEFDVSEMGLTFYLGTLAQPDPPFIAIPAFTSRGFRHGTIYVNTASGIETPRDLIGKTVGEHRCYGHDAGLWSKGILSDEYGVPADSLSYYIGDVRRPAPKPEWLPLRPPSHVRVDYLADDQSLDKMIETGEIAALFSAVEPRALDKGPVRRLFGDHVALEHEYFRKTGIHPTMHTVVIRRALYQKHRWIARALYDALLEAKRRHSEYYRSIATKMHRVLSLPWATELYAENRKLMGDDPWPYGIAANRKPLETALRYHREQGLSQRRFAPEEIFARETIDA
jgi:4,5-dihydroxyphthalate decarboxylase